jgi:hypothetical protein
MRMTFPSKITLRIWPHPNDWCHTCGQVSNYLADVVYKDEDVENEGEQYIRICVKCARLIAAVAVGEIDKIP